MKASTQNDDLACDSEDYRLPDPPWRRWFAWKPVQIGEERYWLKFVYRRKTIWYVTKPSDFAGVCIEGWQYGTIFDVIKTA